MKNIRLFIIPAVILLFIFSSCVNNNIPVSKQTYMMGTIIDIKAYGKNAEKAVQASIEKLTDIENNMSVNKLNSDVSILNKNAGKDACLVNKDTYHVIKKSLYYSNISNGAFDITIEPIVKLWGIGTDNPRVPSKLEIDNALKSVNYKNLLIVGKDKVCLKKSGMAIDLGGIAKGYAADELKKILKGYGINSAFINLGGNIYAIGSKIDNTDWNIGVQNPLADRGDYMGVLSIHDKSVVTSGNYERYFIKNNKKYHHIFNPKTGYPAQMEIISSTIVSDSSIDGDALSTATYVLGLNEGLKLIKSLKGVEAIFITSDKKVYVTPGLKNSFKITNKEFSYEER